MGIGPGFSRPLPYAITAILISSFGHLLRRWLNEGSIPAAPEKGGSIRRLFQALLRGQRVFFKGTAAFNNFLFLSLAYFLGIGITSLFIRKDATGKRPPRRSDEATGAEADAEAGTETSGTYWRNLNPGKKDVDAYYRPF